MDQKDLVKLARLRTMAARADHPFDLMRFVEDRSHALRTLNRLMQIDDEPLLVQCLEVLPIVKQWPAVARVVPVEDAPPPAHEVQVHSEELAARLQLAAIDTQHGTLGWPDH